MNGHARRIRPEELENWIASPLLASDPGYEDWIAGERSFVANIPVENLLIYEEGAEFPGKLALFRESAKVMLFLAPAVRDCPSTNKITAALVDCAVSEVTARGTSELLAIVDSHNRHRNILRTVLMDAGFERRREKILYRMDLDGDLAVPGTVPLSFRSFNDVEDEVLREAMRLHDHRWRDLAEFRQGPSAPGRHWKIVFRSDEFVGLSFLRLDENRATMDYIATVPEARGQGIAKQIFALALNHARRLGATSYLDSTETGNAPMRRIFEEFGCVEFVTRTEYSLILE